MHTQSNPWHDHCPSCPWTKQDIQSTPDDMAKNLTGTPFASGWKKMPPFMVSTKRSAISKEYPHIVFSFSTCLCQKRLPGVFASTGRDLCWKARQKPCESQSIPVVYPEPCKKLKSRPQLFMVGIVPYQPLSARVLIVAHVQC